MSSKKRIDTSSIVNELRGASLFFRTDEPATNPERTEAVPPPEKTFPLETNTVQPKRDTTPPQTGDTMTPRHHDTVIPRHHGITESPAASALKRDLYEPDLIEKVVDEVKKVGTMAATYRFTPEEKSRLGMTVFNLLSSGVRVSENELVRIALNFLLDCLEEGISKYDDTPYGEVVKRLKQPKQ